MPNDATIAKLSHFRWKMADPRGIRGKGPASPKSMKLCRFSRINWKLSKDILPEKKFFFLELHSNFARKQNQKSFWKSGKNFGEYAPSPQRPPSTFFWIRHCVHLALLPIAAICLSLGVGAVQLQLCIFHQKCESFAMVTSFDFENIDLGSQIFYLKVFFYGPTYTLNFVFLALTETEIARGIICPSLQGALFSDPL